MDWIDNKYVGLISNRLDRFKRVGSDANFRCPICGDSKKNKYKTRGYLLDKPIGTIFYCHNCHTSLSLGNFLKRVDHELADQYARERFIEKNNGENRSNPEPKPDFTKVGPPKFMKGSSPLKRIKKISQLAFDHPAKKYVQRRRIPPTYHHKLFYAPKFKAWVNSFKPGFFESIENDEPRLVIPMIDSNGYFIGCQGRAFSKKSIRYLTVMMQEDRPKVFGMDALKQNEQIYVVEGPIDSMFIPNTIAMAGADLNIENVLTNVSRDLVTVVMDNEPRNKQIVDRIDQMIDRGYNVCIWPQEVGELKDINDMILSGIDPEHLKIIIDQNTHSGLQAKAALTFWKKA
jgi:hypothetical protein